MAFSGYNSGALSQWYKNADSLAAATPVTLADGQDLTGIDAALIKGGSISGKVTSSTGLDPSRIYVSVYDADSQRGLGSGASVAADGTYKVGGLKTGSYKIQFSGGNSGALSQWHAGSDSFSSAPVGEISYASTMPAPVSDPKATITLDPAKPGDVTVELNNTASTVSVD